MSKIQFLDDAAKFVGRLFKPANVGDDAFAHVIGDQVVVVALPRQGAGVALIGAEVAPAAGTGARFGAAQSAAQVDDALRNAAQERGVWIGEIDEISSVRYPSTGSYGGTTTPRYPSTGSYGGSATPPRQPSAGSYAGEPLRRERVYWQDLTSGNFARATVPGYPTRGEHVLLIGDSVRATSPLGGTGTSGVINRSASGELVVEHLPAPRTQAYLAAADDAAVAKAGNTSPNLGEGTWIGDTDLRGWY